MELKHIARRQGRLSSVLREDMTMSAGLVNRLKWQERLFVNGIPRHTDFTVSPGDEITVPLDEPTPEYPAEYGELTVLYEDEHILAVDKPAGMLIHPSRSRMTGTLANLVLGHYKKTGQQSAFHPLTRLDRDTFGIVLLAKNSHMHALLADANVKKTYEALIYGTLSEKELTIDAPIARLPLPSLLRHVDPEGKPSVTHLQLCQQLDGYCHVALQPVTGRTHQLRIHCAHIGHPILGDPQYGTEQSQAFSLKHGLSYQQLCAKKLQFIHPITKKELLLVSKLEPSI